MKRGKGDKKGTKNRDVSGQVVPLTEPVVVATPMVGTRSWIGGLFTRSSRRQDKSIDYTLSPLQEERLQKLQDRLLVPFEETRIDHQESLKALWNASFPNINLTGLVTEQWKDMGWQGPNPSTDFRGCGFIALENLLFSARTYPVCFRRLLLKQRGQRALSLVRHIHTSSPFRTGVSSIFLPGQMDRSRKDVEFRTTDGVTLRGYFYAPSGSKRSPCIIMTHGFSGLKEQFLPDFAERFREAGFATLIYDHRSWGSSDGSPRNETDPTRQALDYADAFDYVASLPEVDSAKIVYWGSSMGGGISILAAAFDKRIAAVITQVPFVSGEAIAPFLQTYFPSMYADRKSIKSGNPPAMTKVISETPEAAARGDSGALMGKPDTFPYLKELAQRKQSWETEVTLQSVFNISIFEPRAFIHRISPTPLMMVVAEKDATVPTSSQYEAFAAAGEPKTMSEIENCEHFDLYFGPKFDENISAQLGFLRAALDIRL